MKAVVLDSDPTQLALRWTEWPDPVTTPGWITVKVRAAALNRNDSMDVADRSSRSAPSVIGSDGRAPLPKSVLASTVSKSGSAW